MSQQADQIAANFRTERYATLNRIRWDLFLKIGIPLFEQTIFEPGAGIGDQTEWLLHQGAKRIFVNDGRPDNLEIIRQRFKGNPRLSFVEGNLESATFNVQADLVFLWGVYYHVLDEGFHILENLASVAPVIALDYLESNSDGVTNYGYDNPSTSVSQRATRITTSSMVAALQKTFGYAYFPKEQMDWIDPLAAEPRRIIVGSKHRLDYSGLSPCVPSAAML